MRTPVVLVAGQSETEEVVDVVDVLAAAPGTVTVWHRFDGQVVVRTVGTRQSRSEWALELANGCVSCTIRDDLLVLLRRLHRRSDVTRIVVALPPWLEPEPVCWAIDNMAVRVGPGYIDGPAARDVSVHGVVTCIDTANWRTQAVGDEELHDGRTVAQVVVGQAEFADVLVLSEPERTTLALLRRLTPWARITVGPTRLETALGHLDPNSSRGRARQPHDPLLAGQPPLEPDGEVALVEFSARRPFHPHRLHAALDLLLDGVVRTRGRAWLATRPENVMWIESAGGGLRFSNAGRWLAAMSSRERAYIDPQRLALAATQWDDVFGDRHIAMTMLVCGAVPAELLDALNGALLDDDEASRPDEWETYGDPFGDWHEEPCGDMAAPAADNAGRHDTGEDI